MKKIVIICGTLLIGILLYFVSGLFLICNKPIDSPYVLLEGWISFAALEKASNFIVENNIDSVFVVGMRSQKTPISIHGLDKTNKLKKSRNGYAMYRGGFLGFEIPSEKVGESFVLNIDMHGTSYAGLFPHYRIFQDEKLISSGFVNEQDSVYQFTVSKKATDSLTYVMINFDNDLSGPTEDRNLFVPSISVDSLSIESIMSDHFFIYSAVKQNFGYVPTMKNIKHYMADRGYDTSKVKCLEVNHDPVNKTLALAKGAKKHFKATEVENINIITVEKHSGRTYLNFKHCLEESIEEVGCVPVSTIVDKDTSFFAGIDERGSLLLSWLYWWVH